MRRAVVLAWSVSLATMTASGFAQTRTTAPSDPRTTPSARAAPATTASRPADPARDAALRALAVRLKLPLLDEAVSIFSTQLRRTLPAYFVDSIGRQVGLGPQWRRGLPAYDEAVRRIDAALVADEARDGPLVTLDRADLLSAVQVPWTRDDIAFVDETLDTPLGQEAERAIDAQAARQTIATLKRRVGRDDAARVAAAFDDLEARAQAQFGDASLMLIALKGTDPARAQRLQRLVEAVTLAPSDALGQRIVDRLSQRLLEAAMAQVPALLDPLGGGPVR